MLGVDHPVQIGHDPQFHIELSESRHLSLKIIERFGESDQLLLLLASLQPEPVELGHHLLDTIIVCNKIPQTKYKNSQYNQ